MTMLTDTEKKIARLEVELESLTGTIERAERIYSEGSAIYQETVSWASNRAHDVEVELCGLKGLNVMEELYV